jgi:metal-sulfur cluster biosynthetic enzyme
METTKRSNEIAQIELDIIENILTGVMDPEIEIDIVNLGLVYDLKYDGEQTVLITMTLSTPSCPLGDSIIQDVKQSIRNKYKDFEVDVNLVFEPRWHAGMITPEGKKMLG